MSMQMTPADITAATAALAVRSAVVPSASSAPAPEVAGKDRTVVLQGWYAALKQGEADMEAANAELVSLKQEARKVQRMARTRMQALVDAVRRPTVV